MLVFASKDANLIGCMVLDIRAQTRLAWPTRKTKLLRAHKQRADMSWWFPNSQTAEVTGIQKRVCTEAYIITHKTWKAGDLAISATARHDIPLPRRQLKPLARSSIDHRSSINASLYFLRKFQIS